ncbi:MAG: efflux RND transporter periplasmic adaptor subunit [Planctomycetota bacterium]
MVKGQKRTGDSGGTSGKGLLRSLLHFVLAVVILAAGIFVAYRLIISRKPPQRAEQKFVAPLVEVEQLHAQDIEMVVSGYGTVSPKVQVEIVPQVSGKVVWVHPQFKAGGFIRGGEQILKIDPRDYELAVQQAKAAVAEAQVRLDIEKAEAMVSREEWERLHPDSEPVSSLVFREPQIRQAQARFESSKAGLATAELNLERTQLSVAVDALIISERVDLGQYVMTGQSVGAAYGTHAVEIEVPFEDGELAWFDIPDNMATSDSDGPPAKGAVAAVRADFAGAERTWRGHVVRTTGQVDRTSRLVSVVVEVPEPFKTSGSEPPLLPGMFVEVLINGKVLRQAIAVPSGAIRSGNEVWVVEDGRLHIQTLDIVRTDRDFAYAVSGLADGAMIVVSALDAVTEGMMVRTQIEPSINPAKASLEPNHAGKTGAE